MPVFLAQVVSESAADLDEITKAIGHVMESTSTPGPDRSTRGFALIEAPQGTDIAKTRAASSRTPGVRAFEIVEVSDCGGLLESPTFRSFLNFLGATQFSMSAELASQLMELHRRDVRWVEALRDRESIALFRNPLLTEMVAGSRVLTFGPLEGAMDRVLATMGATSVTGVEGYEPNFLKCRVLQTAFPTLPLEFVHTDFRDVQLAPDYDIVICYGVLYHLSQPQLLLEKIKAIAPKRVFLATQAAVDPPHPAFLARGLGEPAAISAGGRHYLGRWYSEERRRALDYKSALDEEPSFWFYPDALKRLLTDLGFELEFWAEPDQGELGHLVAAVFACDG